MQQWLKSAEDTNEKWRINAENTKLVTNELNHLNAQLEENNKEITALFDFINVGTEEDFYQHHEDYQTYTSNLSRFNDLTKYLDNENYSYELSSSLSEKQLHNLKKKIIYWLLKLTNIMSNILKCKHKSVIQVHKSITWKLIQRLLI